MLPANKLKELLILFLLFSISCQHRANDSNTHAQLQKADQHQSKILIDSSIRFLSDGCLVLRKGNDVISDIFSKLNRSDPSFSHCGIAFFEQQQWVVYHSIGGEDNPNQKLRRDSFEKFVIPSDNTGFGICNLQLKKPEIEKLHTIVDSLFQKEIPFDMQFDLKSDDRLYCAEMVYKAIQQAVANDSLFTLTVHKGFSFVSTDNLFVNKQAQILCRINY